MLPREALGMGSRKFLGTELREFPLDSLRGTVSRSVPSNETGVGLDHGPSLDCNS